MTDFLSVAAKLILAKSYAILPLLKLDEDEEEDLQELEEAALVDGNSRVGAFFNIVLPLARNGILVAAILIFMQAFGEFVYSKSLIQEIELQPSSVGLNAFMGPNTNEWNRIMAFASIYVTPILAIFVLLQRRIVSGLTSGALK